MNRMIFEQRIAEMNKSQRQIAEEVPMRPQRLSEMLAGRLKGWKYQRRLSQVVGVPEEVLFPDNGDGNTSA